jgi:HK97 gp10 family phage protein
MAGIRYQGIFDTMSARDETIQGGRELAELLDTLAPKMQKNINRAGLRAGAAVFLAGIKSRIPVDSGALRDSARITARAKGASVSASVKVGNAQAWYAHLVEFGTRPHVIAPRPPGEALHFGNVAVREVRHPGIAGRPFARPTVDAEFPDAVRAVEKKIRERLTKQGLNVPAPLPADPAE